MMSIGSLRLILIYPKFGNRQNMKVKMFKHHCLLLSANQRQNLPKINKIVDFYFQFSIPYFGKSSLAEPPPPPQKKSNLLLGFD
jgi:hypothetical protein